MDSSDNPYDTGTPHKLFDAHNLLFGLTCFGAPLLILGIMLVRSWRNCHFLCKVTFNVCTVLVVVHIFLFFTLLFTSALSMYFGFETL